MEHSIDMEKVIKAFDEAKELVWRDDDEYAVGYNNGLDAGKNIAISLLKEQDSLLGIHQTADGITFISTGTAQVAEKRGILLGKLFMHEWLEKKLLYSGLLTDDIRTVFDEAKRW